MDLTPNPCLQNEDIGTGAAKAARSLAMSPGKMVVAISAKVLVQASIGTLFMSVRAPSGSHKGTWVLSTADGEIVRRPDPGGSEKGILGRWLASGDRHAQRQAVDLDQDGTALNLAESRHEWDQVGDESVGHQLADFVLP